MKKILKRRRGTPVSLLLFGAVALANISAVTLPAAGQTISMAAVGPSSLDFGQHIVGTESTAVPVILANAGSDPLAIKEIVRSGDFAATHDCPDTLPPGSECHIVVSFKPTTVGHCTGELTISNDAGTQRVLLRGAATAASKPSESRQKGPQVAPSIR
jgi:hypothetical protein